MIFCMFILAMLLVDEYIQSSPQNESSNEMPDLALSMPEEKMLSMPVASTPEVAMQKMAVDFESLQIACPEIRVKMTEECFAVLEQYFIDTTLPLIGNSRAELLHTTSKPTFRRLFANPMTDLENTIAALNDEACRLEKGVVRNELEIECHAASIANHALFNRYCSVMQGTFRDDWFGPEFKYEGESYFQQALNQLESLHWENLDDYHASIQELNEHMYRDAWLNMKCAQFGSQVRQPLHQWPSISQSNEDHVSETYADGTMDWSEDAEEAYVILVRADEYRQLLGIAARLGDDWATVSYYSNWKGLGDDDYMKSVEEMRPWLSPLLKSFGTNNSRVSHLINAVEAVRMAEIDGVALNKELLASMVCRARENASDCDSAFDRLPTMDLSSRMQQIGDELRRIYSELEPASKCFDNRGEEVPCERINF